MRPDRKATTVHCHALAGVNVGRQARRGDLQLRAAVSGANPKDVTDFLN